MPYIFALFIATGFSFLCWWCRDSRRHGIHAKPEGFVENLDSLIILLQLIWSGMSKPLKENPKANVRHLASACQLGIIAVFASVIRSEVEHMASKVGLRARLKFTSNGPTRRSFDEAPNRMPTDFALDLFDFQPHNAIRIRSTQPMAKSPFFPSPNSLLNMFLIFISFVDGCILLSWIYGHGHKAPFAFPSTHLLFLDLYFSAIILRIKYYDCSEFVRWSLMRCGWPCCCRAEFSSALSHFVRNAAQKSNDEEKNVKKKKYHNDRRQNHYFLLPKTVNVGEM